MPASTAKPAAAAGSAFGDVPERWTIDHGGVTLDRQARAVQTHRRLPRAGRALALDDTTPRAGGGEPLEILNLFAYTGGATVALAKAGHKVTHVDASKPALAWARENAAANGLGG